MAATPADFAPIEQGSFWLPAASSTIAAEIDFGWNLAMWISVVFFLLVAIPTIVFAFKFRRKHEHELPPPTGHNTALEIAWSVIPLAIVMACFFVGFRGYVHASIAPADSYEIKVTGQKWLWTSFYPNDTVSPGELRVPAGRNIKLITSSKDVIHSFWVPEFRIKQDVVPGLYTSLWFNVPPAIMDDPSKLEKDNEGYTVRRMTVECTEYCGKDHSMMLAHVIVMKERDYAEWLNPGCGPSSSPEENGEKLFTKNACNTCHSITDKALPGGGPAFKGLVGRQEKLVSGATVTVDDAYIARSIFEPAADVVAGFPPIMPPYKGQLNEKQVGYLIAYLKTLQ